MKLFDGHCDTAYELWTRGELFWYFIIVRLWLSLF